MTDVVSLPPIVSTLPNGVTLVNAPSPSRNIAVILIVRAGSRDEGRQTAGLAHFLEHMFFKGTKKRPTALEIQREIDAFGGDNNAGTDVEEVAYYISAPVMAMRQGADILTDMMCHPLFLAEEMERERNVVIQELDARYADPGQWVMDTIGEAAFGGDQPMAWTAGGFKDVIAKVPRDDLVAYHQSFYAPEAMALVVAGGDQLSAEEAHKLLADLPSAKPKQRVPATWGLGPRYVESIRPDNPQTELLFATKGMPATDGDRTAMAVAQCVLGGGMSSRLFHTVRERSGLAYKIFAFHESFEDTGEFCIVTGCRPEDAAKATSLSFREYRKLAEEKVPDYELTSAKAALVGRLLRGTETAMASARYYSTRWRAYLPLETPDQRAEAINQVTADQVQAVFQRLAPGIDDVRIAYAGPKAQGDELLEAATSATAGAPV